MFEESETVNQIDIDRKYQALSLIACSLNYYVAEAAIRNLYLFDSYEDNVSSASTPNSS